jgi:hypothetical protein
MAARSGWRHLVSAVAIGLVVLASPSAAAAADDPVTGSAVVGAAIDPATWPNPGVEAGPVLLLLVAGTLGLLGVLSGPEPATPARRPVARPRARAR